MKHFVLLFLNFLLAANCFSQDRTYYKKVIDTTTNKELKLLALDSLSENLKYKDPKEIANYTEQLVDLAIELEDYDLAIEKTIRIFYTMNVKLRERDRALALVEKVEPYLKKTKDSYLVGGLYQKKAGAYANGKNYKKAVDYFTKSISSYSQGDSIYKADAIYFRGQAQQSLGNYLDAINDYNLASKYYEAIGDKAYMFYTKASVITIYGENGFDNKTIEERKKLIAKKREENFNQGLAIDYYNQSLGYKSIGNTKKEEENLLNTLKYLETDEDINKYYKASFYSHIGEFYARQKNFEKAKELFNKAETFLPKNQENSLPELTYYENKASYFYLLGNYDEAINLALKTKADSDKFNRITLTQDLNEVLYKSYREKGDKTKALNYFESNVKIKDSIFNTKKTNALSYYQTLYETEKKEKEIEQQKADIKLLEIQNKAKQRLLLFLIVGALLSLGLLGLFLNRKRLKKEQKLQENYSQKLLLSQELERKRISKDLHDGLGQSLLLIKNKVALNNDDNTKSLLNNAIDEMRSISRTLHPFQLEEIGITKALENLITQIDENTKTYVFGDIEQLHETLTNLQEVNIFRIVQECLSNIIKHAQADSAKVTLVKTDSHINISIKDNGVGFDFSEKLNDFKSLGLKTIKERVKFLKGTLKINSTKNEGTTFDILFPIV